MGVYYKVRKIHIGNRWKTQFVTLHREEVKRLQEYQKSLALRSSGNSVWAFIEKVEREYAML
jgi:hypothetical protein